MFQQEVKIDVGEHGETGGLPAKTRTILSEMLTVHLASGTMSELSQPSRLLSTITIMTPDILIQTCLHEPRGGFDLRCVLLRGSTPSTQRYFTLKNSDG